MKLFSHFLQLSHFPIFRFIKIFQKNLIQSFTDSPEWHTIDLDFCDNVTHAHCLEIS